jgi:hypothetical protein
MNEELKIKLHEMLESYSSQLDTIWYNSDSGSHMDWCRRQQAEIAELIAELEAVDAICW